MWIVLHSRGNVLQGAVFISGHLSGGIVSAPGPTHRAVCERTSRGLSWRVIPKMQDATKLLPLEHHQSREGGGGATSRTR